MDLLLHGLVLSPPKSLPCHKNVQVGYGPNLLEDPQFSLSSLLHLGLHFKTENNYGFLQIH